jgi:hypothetical protein
MRVDDVNLPSPNLVGELPGDAKIESRTAAEHDQVNAIADKLGAERSLIVEAEDRRVDSRSEPPDGLDDQPLGARHLHHVNDKTDFDRRGHGSGLG